MPVLRYSFGIVNWHQEELQKLDRKTRKLNNHSWTASPKGRCRTLVCSQKTGRKGLDAVRSSQCSRNYKLVEYVDGKKDPLIQVVRTHQHNTDSAVLHTA